MANYFRFEIPPGLTYSPGWFGTMPHCPEDVTVDLYNDKEGYGIAHTEDVLPKEVKPLDAKEALALIASVKEDEGVYFGEKVLERVSWLPEADVKEDPVDEKTAEITGQPVVSQKAQFCPICHCFIMNLPDNLKAAKIIMTCSNGHKVTVTN